MRKIFLTLFLGVFSTIFASPLVEKELSYKEAVSQAKKSNKDIMLFVYSTYCPWCTKMEQTTLSDPQVISFIEKNFVFVGLNMDIDDIPQRFIPRGTPTTYVIDPITENKKYSMRGYKSSSSLLSRAQR